MDGLDMSDHSFAEDLQRSAIHPDARVSGASYLSGPRTSVGAGAVVENSRLHNVAVSPGARVVDSIVVAEGRPGSHRCDAAGRVVVGGAETPEIGAGAGVEGATLINTSVAAGAIVRESWARDAKVGEGSEIGAAKLILVETGRRVTVTGPTEVSEARLGDFCTIDRRGYYEGVFSNCFRQLEFDEAAGKLRVAGTIHLPHVSRYGVNTVNSTNSGKLLPQPDGVLEDLGPHVGLWADALLSHEQIELGPCCWVAPWTKVIGQSPDAHEDDDQLVNDALMTYVMPFALAGWEGQSTNGLVMPGELSVGYGPKKRKGAWVFTYAPDLVIRAVHRLHAALEPQRRQLADTVVVEAIKSALAMTRAMAAERGVDLAGDPAKQRRGWPRWIAGTHALLRLHLEARLWEFEGGQPLGWELKDGRWTHPRIGELLKLAPDALEKQLSEEQIFDFEDPVPPLSVALPVDAVPGTGGAARVDAAAEVAADAFVGPGAIVGPGCRVESGARVWNSVLEESSVAAGAVVERCVLANSSVGQGSVARSSALTSSKLAAASTAECATLSSSQLSERATVSAFADLRAVSSRCGTILGGAFENAEVETVMMSMHLAGHARHVRFVPLSVELAGGRRVKLEAVPMIGGGAVLRGTAEEPLVLECSFIGSNATIEPGCFVGYGCFLLGRLPAGEGVPPLTMGSGPLESHVIGGALGSVPSTVITHFINWTFQALGPTAAPAVAAMTTSAIGDGLAAVEAEIARRGGGPPPDPDSPGARYASLARYSDRQLESGAAAYRAALESGAWELDFDGEKLVFSSDKGRWRERSGSAFWEAL
jgi:UDP-3-O-[3-hydroxymyristoyl] glucosamine N-acyltransferase